MQHDHRRHQGHQHDSTKTLQDKSIDYDERSGDRQHHGGNQHDEHDKHAGHKPEIFKRRFFICLALTLPVLYFAPSFQEWFNYQAVQFPGSAWITPILSVIIYFYGGWVRERFWVDL